MTITEFLEARIAEDEADARHRAAAEEEYARSIGYAAVGVVPIFPTPVRVLAECAAKRAIIDLQFDYAQTIDGEWGCCHEASDIRSGRCPRTRLNDRDDMPILFALAAAYKDHPDYYQQEWEL